MYGQAGRKQMYGREVKLVRVSTFDSRMRERDTGSRNPGAYILRRQCLVFFLVFMTMAALSLAVACIFKEDIFGSRESVVVMGEESLSAAAPQAEFSLCPQTISWYRKRKPPRRSLSLTPAMAVMTMAAAGETYRR